MPCRPPDGPKLRVFTDDLFGYHDVEFIDMVFAGPKDKSSEVYKARIDGKLCCLKVVSTSAVLSPCPLSTKQY